MITCSMKRAELLIVRVAKHENYGILYSLGLEIQKAGQDR